MSYASAHLQCDYDNPESACKHCFEKGKLCGPKVSARRWLNRVNHVPGQDMFSISFNVRKVYTSDDGLTSFEEMHVSALRENKILFRFSTLQSTRQDGHTLNELLF